MKLLFDDEIFIYQRFGGVSRIFSELINNLENDQEIQLLFNCFYSENEYLSKINKVNTSPLFKDLHFPLKGKIQRSILKQISHPRINQIIRENKTDLFHPSFYSNYYIPELVNNKNIGFIFTVHDLIHEKFPYSSDFKKIAEYKSQNIHRANQIVVVSENTKNNLLEFYPTVSPDKITVNYLSHSIPIDSETVSGIDEKYILHVGERHGYKNAETLFKAFEIFHAKNPEFQLICTGNRTFTHDEKVLMKNLGILNNVKQIAVNEYQLKFLYENAFAFVFPSKYEGFGIPVLEAMHCGTPAILSSSSSLPEIGSNAALYFDPSNPIELSDILDELCKHPSLRNELIQKGKERVKLFSWNNHINTMKMIYKKTYETRSSY